MALLKGLGLTLRSMGPKWVAEEITRRIVGKPYTYNGILVKEAVTGSSSGLLSGGTQIRVMPIEEVLADVVKMDCEGCEWSLLSIPCAVIKRAEE